MSKPISLALSGLTFLGRLRPTLGHFARCWRHLRGTSSRRTLEVGMAAMMLTQIIRLLQALHRVPPVPFIQGGHAVLSRLTIAGDTFYLSLWPSPWVWVYGLSGGILLTLIGLQQTVAAINVARTGGNTLLLTETGEDDPKFLSSVREEWLLADVRLRRVGLEVGMAFFAELAWYLLFRAGMGQAGPFVVLALLCSFADNRLWDMSKRLQAMIETRTHAEVSAMTAALTSAFARPV